MDQLPLNISPRLPYSPEGFLMHDGVADIVRLCTEAFAESGFKIIYIHGPTRSGKTHLSIELADLLSKQGRYPKLVEGRDLSERIGEFVPRDSRDVLIVDDAQEYLETLKPGDSGPFVNCVELYRKAQGGIILLSSKEITEFTCDDHAKSRLLSAIGGSIKPPSAEFLPELINRMAKQRGIKLTDRKISFLLKRLERNIQEIEEYLERVNYLSSIFGKAIKMPLLSDAL